MKKTLVGIVVWSALGVAGAQAQMPYESMAQAFDALAHATAHEAFSDAQAGLAETLRRESTEGACFWLSLLPNQDLARVADLARGIRRLRNSPCGREQLARAQAYWTEQARSLEAREAERFQFNASLAAEEPSPIPVVEVPIDPREGQYLVSADLPQGTVALTFDDGPHVSRTPRVLQILERYGVRATFFEVGGRAQRWPEVSRAVVAAGHSLGSHSHSHQNLPRISVEAAEREISLGRHEVFGASGVDTGFFRFPFGARTAGLQEFVRRERMATFFWNMDTNDWRTPNPSELLAEARRLLDRYGRGIMLMHDTLEQTSIVLPHLLDEMSRRGMRAAVFVRRDREDMPAPVNPGPLL